MAIVDILLPQFGMGMKEGEIVRWLKAVGDRVEEGEILFEVEAAKATAEVNAPASGRLVEILIDEGQTIEVRTPVGRIDTD